MYTVYIYVCIYIYIIYVYIYILFMCSIYIYIYIYYLCVYIYMIIYVCMSIDIKAVGMMFISVHIPDLKNHILYTLLFAIHYSAGSTGFLHISLCYMFCVLSYSFYCMNFIILYCIVIYCILYYLHYIHII